MIKASILCVILLSSLATSQQKLDFGVQSKVQSQLDSVLTALINELRLFNTSFQDNNRLHRQIDFTYEVISILLRELRPYNTVVQGQNNYLSGTKDIVLGSFNNVTGGGNWIFTNYFTGHASGDLIVQRYRVQMDKKHLASTRPDLVVFLLTPTETGQYSKYINPNKNLPNAQSGVISLLKLAGIASQQIDSYNVPYQPPQPQTQPSQFQPSQFQPSQFQPSQFKPSQFKPSQSQSSSNSFGFQMVPSPIQPGSQQNLRENGGFTQTSNSNMGGFTASSGFTTTSSPSVAGFTRV